MRLIAAALVVLGGLALGYSGAASAQADPVPAGVRVGDTLRIIYPDAITAMTTTCTVAAIRDGFVRCKPPAPSSPIQSPPALWYNLRLAWQVSIVPPDPFAIQ